MNKRVRFLIVLFTLFISDAVVNAQLTGDAIQELRRSTVRVQSGSKVSTGFLWKKNNWVVTTLHSIDQSDNIRVTLVDQVRTAKVEKVLKRYDLALLKLDRPVSLPIIKDNNDDVELNSKLYVLGYNGKGNLSNIIGKSLTLGYNSNGKLTGLLNKKLIAELSACNSPDPRIDILYLEGSLLPGFSGAPIVDKSGRLVGIADGGLEEGTKSISWGIDGRFLNDLTKSSEQFKSQFCSVESRTIKFATENLLDDELIDFVTYKEFKFIKTKTRTIDEMLNTVDDPEGLNALINDFELNSNVDYSNFSYDIYTDLNTGATICVPEGIKLEVQNDLLVGRELRSNLVYVAWSKKTENNGISKLVQYQNASITFDQKIQSFSRPDLSYVQDPNYSYPTAKFKPNGLVVNRKSFYGYFINVYGNSIPQNFIFETHAAYNDTYIGMAAINLKNDTSFINKLNGCVFSGECKFSSSSNECSYVCKNYKIFSQIVIGAYMGGFSNIGY